MVFASLKQALLLDIVDSRPNMVQVLIDVNKVLAELAELWI